MNATVLSLLSTPSSRLTLVLALAAFALAFAPPANADAINFDGAITQPATAPPPVDLGIALDYETPDVPPGPPEALYTQGFAFGGRTEGVTGGVPTKPGFGIITDPTVCLTVGTTCVDNGTRTLAFDIAASMTREDFSPFSIFSFSASQPFEDDTVCPECAEGVGLQNVEILTVSGFSEGTLTVQQTFEISFGYRTFTLTDPDWAAVDRVVFQPLDGDGTPGIANVNPCCTMVLDNIELSIPTPAISEGGIVNGATFLEDQLLSRGAIVTVFGPNIGLDVTEKGLIPFEASANSIPLPDQLGGYSLLIDDNEVPLFFVGGREVVALDGEDEKGAEPTFVGQINAQVPWETIGGGPVEVKVRRASPSGMLDSEPAIIQLAPASPGIFEFPTGQAIVTNFSLGNDGVTTGSWAQPAGSVPNVQTEPAPVNGIAIIWCMGLGPVSPPVETGNIPESGAPISETVKTVRVFIGGVEAEIFGKPVLQSTNVALYQINARVPMIPPGDTVPILIQVLNEDGTVLESRTGVTIAVRPAVTP